MEIEKLSPTTLGGHENRLRLTEEKINEIIDNINKIILRDNQDNSLRVLNERGDRQGKDKTGGQVGETLGSDKAITKHNGVLSQPAVCSKGYFCPCHDKSGDNKDCCPMCKKEVKDE